jgi:hypothetical protein
LDLVNVFNLGNAAANASMDAHDPISSLFVIDNGSQG